MAKAQVDPDSLEPQLAESLAAKLKDRGNDIATLDAAIRASYHQRDKLVYLVYEAATGVKLPKHVTFTDSEGTLWNINARLTLTRVVQGKEVGRDDPDG